jgi:carboxylesterase type B
MSGSLTGRESTGRRVIGPVRARFLHVWLGAVGAAAATVLCAGPAAAQEPTPGSLVVQTAAGDVEGTSADGVDSFLGMPYAAPPVGQLRWRPPGPVTAWQDVRAARAYGNRCPVAVSSNGPRSETEDCLFINVQRPTGLEAGDDRPVYVFIHGGGLHNGSSNQGDMAAIVRRTGVVGITMNYRLGVLGFLSTAGLSAERGESGNYGLMDQQAALRWVRDNVTAFGGDPGRVTIGGESAGGWSVCAHLSAPASAGLFAGAMMQSGSCASQTQAAAQTSGAATAAAVGCAAAATQVACLRSTPVGRLLDAPSQGFQLFVRGTSSLPTDPRAAIASGNFARVPVVIGANRDEGRTFQAGAIGWSREQYVAWVRQSYPAIADAVLARYPWPERKADRFTAAYLSGAIVTDSGGVLGIGGCTNRKLTQDFASHTRTYAYEFNHRTGPGLTPIPGYVWGAGHAAELAYLFPSFDNGTPIAPLFDRDEQLLAGQMKDLWGTFALTGEPAARRTPDWPTYSTQGRTIMSLEAGYRSHLISDAALSARHHCAFWDRVAAV